MRKNIVSDMINEKPVCSSKAVKNPNPNYETEHRGQYDSYYIGLHFLHSLDALGLKVYLRLQPADCKTSSKKFEIS